MKDSGLGTRDSGLGIRDSGLGIRDGRLGIGVHSDLHFGKLGYH